MSLILDALRKLEHQKGAQEPGVLVVGSVPWGETSRARRLALRGGALVVVALAVLAGWLLRRAPAAPVPAARPATAVAPTPAPTPSAGALLRATAPPPTALAPPPEPVPPIRLSHAPAAEPARLRPADRTAAPSAPAADAPGQPVVSTPPTSEPSPETARTAPPPLAGAAPTPAAAASGSAADGLRLTAISQRDGKPVALINDRLVFEGDSFDGIRVVRIGETEVEIEIKGQRRVLRF